MILFDSAKTKHIAKGVRGMLKEFKNFALKGNAMDLAVGIIIGAAFGKIVSSLVSDIIMPVISLITGKIDFSNMFISLNGVAYNTLEEAKAAGASTFNYGVFITSVIDFIFIAFAIFIIVQQLDKLRKKSAAPAPAAPAVRDCPYCLSSVPAKAVKCAHCLSVLEPEK
jgi:large conductance mechanosensitive channel